MTEASGAPLAVCVSAGNENERGYLLALVDGVSHGVARHDPQGAVTLWADRGYDSEPLREQLCQRGIEPRISRRRHHRNSDGPASPAGTRKNPGRRVKRRDPDARHRWPIERTNAWLLAWRRVATRYERNAAIYTSIVLLVLVVVLLRKLDGSF